MKRSEYNTKNKNKRSQDIFSSTTAHKNTVSCNAVCYFSLPTPS